LIINLDLDVLLGFENSGNDQIALLLVLENSPFLSKNIRKYQEIGLRGMVGNQVDAL
jgi:hypothetical protein